MYAMSATVLITGPASLDLAATKTRTRNPLKNMKPGPALLVLASLIQGMSPGITLLKIRN